MAKPDVPDNPPVVQERCDDVWVVGYDDHVAAVKRADEEVTGFSESERDGLRGSADMAPDGTVHQLLVGKSPQGEADTFHAARILLQRLNADGACWGEPREREPPADVEAIDTRDPSRRLWLQVTRAVGNEDLWQRLRKLGNASQEWSNAEVVSEVRDAIRRKGDSKYSTEEANHLVLALDANRLPGLVMDQVRNAIIRELGAFADETPFIAVWLVGPMPDLCYQVTHAG